MDASDLRAWESAENSRNKGSTFSHNSWSYIKPQISSATNAACNSNSNATYLVSYWPPWTAEEGGIASFFGKVLGLVLAPKMCPHQSQGFKEVNISQAFTVGRRKNAIFFSGRAASRCSKTSLYKVSRKYSKNCKNCMRRTRIKSNLTPKIENTLKPSNYDAKPWFMHFTAQKSKCLRCFWELDPETLHTYLVCPCPAFYEWGFLLCFFRRKCGVP